MIECIECKTPTNLVNGMHPAYCKECGNVNFTIKTLKDIGNLPQVNPANPKDKLGLKKVPLRFVSPISIVQQSVAMNLGGMVKGYGPYNWRETAVNYSVYLEAALRHLLLLMDGEDNDDESKGPHESSIAACMSILMDAKATGKLIDDRYKSGQVKRIMKEVEETLKRQAAEYKKDVK